MNIKGFYLFPHPPIVIPEVGKGEEVRISNTSENLHNIGREIESKAPNTIIVITPHGTMFQDAISLTYVDSISGSLENFGIPEVSMELSINKNLTSKIYELAIEEDIPVVMSTNKLLSEYNTSITLDHGTIVPIYFVNKYYKDYNIVHITYAPLRDIDLYKFGKVINHAIETLKEDVVIIASGDLSHRLREDGPYGYNQLGKKFDKEFIHNLKEGNISKIFKMDKKTIFDAGECGRRSILIMLGTLDNTNFNGELLSYEDTFGVGYGVMKFNVISKSPSKLSEIKSAIKSIQEKKLNQTDPYVKLARESLTTYLSTGEILKEMPSYVTNEMKSIKKGVFVSLKKHGELRGCIGTIFPTRDSIAHEIIKNAIDAGINDHRFFQVEEDELLDIDFSVDILTEPEIVTKKDLNPKKYGVIVSSNERTGLLLPALEGVDTVEEQLSIALSKAGINEDENYTIERFEVIRHFEE